MNVQFGRVPGVDCSARAVYVVEGYAPADGRAHGSLDVTVRVCAEHVEECRTKWLAELGAPTPYVFLVAVPAVCGDMTDFRDPQPQDVEPETQDVGEVMPFGRARKVKPEPQRYKLKVDGQEWLSGTLQDVQAHVAELVTTLLASNPAGLAEEAQALNEAFTSGAVQRELDERAIWYTILGAHTTQPVRIRITDEK